MFSQYWMQMLYQHSLAYLELHGLLGHVRIAEHLPFGPLMRRELDRVERGAKEVEQDVERVSASRIAGRVSHALTKLVQLV